MAIIEATNETFDCLIEGQYAVVDCYGDFCTGCIMLEPIYAAAANDMAFVRFSRINISKYTDIADRFGLLSMPTLLYFRNGKLVHQTEGSMPREELNKHLAKMLYA